MPTYGYRCTSCGIEFERFQKMTDPPVTDCECGATGTVKKRLYPVGIQFKGSGFYVNDYTKAGKESSVKSKEGESSSESKTETKTETKTEAPAKTETAPAPAPAKA